METFGPNSILHVALRTFPRTPHIYSPPALRASLTLAGESKTDGLFLRFKFPGIKNTRIKAAVRLIGKLSNSLVERRILTRALQSARRESASPR